MAPTPIVKDQSSTIDETIKTADLMNRLAADAYTGITGKPNRLPKSLSTPVVCVNLESGFWQLECNDPDLSRDVLQAIVTAIRHDSMESLT